MQRMRHDVTSMHVCDSPKKKSCKPREMLLWGSVLSVEQKDEEEKDECSSNFSRLFLVVVTSLSPFPPPALLAVRRTPKRPPSSVLVT